MDMGTAKDRLGKQVERRRAYLGLTIDEAASKEGLSPVTWRRVESGKNVRVLTYGAIERALDWAQGSVDAILSGEEPTVRDESHGPRGTDSGDHSEFPPEIAHFANDAKFMKIYNSLSPEQRRDTIDAIVKVKRRGDERTEEDVQAHINAIKLGYQAP